MNSIVLFLIFIFILIIVIGIIVGIASFGQRTSVGGGNKPTIIKASNAIEDKIEQLQPMYDFVLWGQMTTGLFAQYLSSNIQQGDYTILISPNEMYGGKYTMTSTNRNRNFEFRKPLYKIEGENTTSLLESGLLANGIVNSSMTMMTISNSTDPGLMVNDESFQLKRYNIEK